MENRIRLVQVRNRSTDPAEAEVRVTVVPEHRTAGTEVRGRLMGPRCLYAGTVEVAYPLRPLARPGSEGAEAGGLALRVVIPEASLWEPASPFLYQGPVELWQDGRRCDAVTLTHGLRQLSLGSRGLRVNGRPLALRGRAVEGCSEEQARALHEAGYNLLLAPVTAEAASLWDVADRAGLLVLGRVGRDILSAGGVDLAGLAAHASCLGWVVGGPHPDILAGLPAGPFVCREGTAGEQHPPAGVHFLLTPGTDTGGPASLVLPGGAGGGPVVLGTVE